MNNRPLSGDDIIPRRVLHGRGEAIFTALPASVRANFLKPRSENALLWNLIYPLCRPNLDLRLLLSIRPLWGTRLPSGQFQDALTPYFWGLDVGGNRLKGLDDALGRVDGPGPRTEIDLLLVGEHHLLAIEAKHTGRFGICSRYQQGRCPEVHTSEERESEPCRYWSDPAARFMEDLLMGPRPEPAGPRPACHRHYQLARTLKVALSLAESLDLEPWVWLILPRRRWRSLEKNWLDFSERVRDSALWRRLRVLEWEALQALSSRLDSMNHR